MAERYAPSPTDGGTGPDPSPHDDESGEVRAVDDAGPPTRYDANLRLIRRRLADQAKTGSKPRPWWKRFGTRAV